MKYILLVIFTLLVTRTFSQEIPDGDFETWTSITQGNANYEEPAGDWWGSLNNLRLLGGPVTLTKTTEAYTGNYAVMLETIAWGNDLVIPGILTAGYFDATAPITQNLIQGRAYTKRPVSFDGYYKYLPQTGDTCGIYANLTKYNETTGKTDTIAEASFAIDETISEYSKFSITFEYRNEETPDTLNIVFTSSLSGQNLSGQVGSKLYIDNISMNFSNSIEKTAAELPFLVINNQEIFEINAKANKAYLISFYSVTGALLYQQHFNKHLRIKKKQHNEFVMYVISDNKGIKQTGKTVL